MIEIYTAEAFTGDGYELVYCTTERDQLDEITLEQFDTNILSVKKWLNGEFIDGYLIEE